MNDYCLYEVDKKDKIATITFNRPEKLHAFAEKEMREIVARLDDAEADDNVKVVIFKGTGKAFGGGYDVMKLGSTRGLVPGQRPSQRERLTSIRPDWWGQRGVLQRIFNCTKATISQVHGYCYGGHFEIMVACDLAVASDDALFAHPGYRYVGPEGPIMLYVLMMGLKRVKQMMLLGRPMTAQQALDYGLINLVVPRNKLEDETLGWAKTVAQVALDGIVVGKASFNLQMDMLGVPAGYTAAWVTHAWMSNLKFDPGEFNLLKELKDKGKQGAYAERDSRDETRRLKKNTSRRHKMA